MKTTNLNNREIKYCQECNKTKDIDCFYKNKNTFDGHSCYCKDCEYKRSGNYKHRSIWNKNHKESINKAIKKYQDGNPIKVSAKKLVKKAISDSILVRQPCEKCGNPKSQGHHPDYTKPLEVIWLCAKHHKEAHGYRIFNNL